MPHRYYLGLDISTTSAKALLIDDRGQVVGTSSTALELSAPHPLWSEQDPGAWWQGIVESIRQVLSQTEVDAERIMGVGLTGQMHGLVCLDGNGDVLRPAILWNDQRTGAECDRIRELLGRETLIRITGNDALTGFTAPKILWVRAHEPEVYARIEHVLLPKDYVRYRLSGAFATDKAGAAGTLLLDVAARDWSREVLDALQIPRAWLPETHEGMEITGEVSEEAARLTGLRAGTPVVGGGGDQAAGAVGVGAVESGVASLVLGTSGVVFASTDEPFIEPQGLLHSFCHAIPSRWHMMGVMLSAAGSLQWHRDTFAADMSFDDLLAPAAAIAPGAEGLFFTPYLTGERTPYPDPHARAAFAGLTRSHALPHMTRAVLEGVAFGLRDIFGLIESAGLRGIGQVRVSGGGARSALWRQILADVLGRELVTVNTTEGAAFGAALLAAVGMGEWTSVPSACAESIHIVQATAPCAGAVQKYDGLYPLYRGLYAQLKPTFDALAAGLCF